jgi:hypothetical protein
MTSFGKLIKVLNSTKVFRCPRNALGVKILNAAGIPEAKLTEDVVAKWIDRKVPYHIASPKYFPDGKVNEIEVIEYLQSWAGSKWEKLQVAFLEEANFCIVNCTTKNRDEFFRSILNQLTESLGLPLPEEPTTETVTANEPAAMPSDINKGETMSQNESPPEQMLTIFKQSVFNFSIERCIKSEPTHFLNSDFFDNVNRFVKSIENNVKYKFPRHKKEVTYQRIIDFACVLSEYAGYLRNNTQLTGTLTDTFKIPTQDGEKISVTPYQQFYTYTPSNNGYASEEWKNEYATKTGNYRQQILSLLNEIGIDIK